MEKEQASNNEVLKESLLTRSYLVETRKEITDNNAKEHDRFIEVMKELHFQKKRFMPFTILLIMLLVGIGYIFGTQHETIAPFFAKLWDIIAVFKTGG